MAKQITLPFSYERGRIITVKNLLLFILLLKIAFIAKMFFNAKKRNVLHHYLDVGFEDGKGKEIKIFFISDIHRRKIDQKLIRKIDNDIDIVIVGGDLAEKGVRISRIAENVQNLSSLGQVFFVWGNNDREAGEESIRKIMAENDGIILDNENCPIPGFPLWGICGTDDPSSRKLNLEATIQGVEQYDYVLFVSHQPQVLDKVQRFFQPTLMFAGHTHGGQIRIGKLGLFCRGAFQKNSGRGKLISNGYGTSTIPFRLGAPSESHVITLKYVERATKEWS